MAVKKLVRYILTEQTIGSLIKDGYLVLSIVSFLVYG